MRFRRALIRQLRLRRLRLRQRGALARVGDAGVATKPPREQPLRAELLTLDEMVVRAGLLAQQHRISDAATDDRLLARLGSNSTEIARARTLLEANLRDGIAITPAGEWLLDNRHVIEEQIQLARRHLPARYNRTLPILANPQREGLPRVFDIAGWLVAHADAHVDVGALGEVLAAYQAHQPLNLGELWAVPIMLRLALVENLRRISVRVQRDALEQREAKLWAGRINEAAARGVRQLVITVAELAASGVTPSRTFISDLTRHMQGVEAEAAPAMAWIERWAAEAGTAVETMLAEESRKQAADQVSVANAIGSLRALSGIDWRAFVEAHSAVEALLRQDPHGAYPAMDFETRDRYRHAIERLARQAGLAETEVVREVLALARQAAPGGIESHVGWWLLEQGRNRLREVLNRRARPGRRVARHRTRLHLGLYLLPIAAITALGVCLALRHWPGGGAWWASIALALAAGLVASELGIVLTNWVATLTVKPRPLPRMDFEDGIPEHAATLVVVPTLIGSAESIDLLVEALEIRYLGNRQGAIRFALLTDFPDAKAEQLSTDAALLAHAAQAIGALNARHPWYGVGDRFVLLHRPRVWNESESCYMGRERKRGKLAALNALLRGGDQAEFQAVFGDTTGLGATRYVITLDTDTQLPRNAAAGLAAAMAHPLNAPLIDADRRIVVRGYGLLQPGLGSTMSGRGHSRFARLFGSESGIDPYTRTVSDVYQDLFSEGSFVGKGIYDVDAFEQVLGGRFPDNRILSHDLLEGNYVHAGLITDVRVYEDHPARYAADIKRRARWIRGDWQLLPWLLPRVPLPGGRRERNPMSWLALGKLVDNLRRSLVPIAALALLLAGWRQVATPLGWTLGVLALWFLPALLRALIELPQTPSQMSRRAHLSEVLRELRRSLWRGVVQLSCLAYEAGVHASAIARTLWRLLLTRQRLLEWDTSVEVERRLRAMVRPEVRQMAPGAVFAAAVAGWLALVRPEALAAAAPLLIGWLAAPQLMAWLGGTPPPAREVLDAGDVAFAQRLARRTWAFFEDLCVPEEHFLPPDNLQLEPTPRIAHRTSPTNIGLSLLANLSAWDLGFVQRHELHERVDRTLHTLERLERFRGHFYNWYDTTTLEPLTPRYVSTVDSGNLAAHLLVLAQGLRELAEQQEPNPQTHDGLDASFQILRDTLAQERVPLPAAALEFEARLRARAPLQELLDALHAWPPWPEGTAEPATRWRARLAHQLSSALAAEQQRGASGQDLEPLAARAEALAQMDFTFLYASRQRLLHIGYSFSDDRLDASFYDLLASEARLTTFLAVALGQLPQESWFALGRAQTEVDGEGVLLSWSGSMFEYLMPDLVMPSYPDTLLDAAVRKAVRAQITYGEDHGVPWGISESGYHAFDLQMNYQYRAFGVPALAMKRGLGRDLVIAPYAAAMATMVEPGAALANLRAMDVLGFAGEYGMHEAIDYTRGRLPQGREHVVLRSYMAHHQGMTLLALARVLAGPRMQARFSAIPAFRAALLLLQERVPRVGVFHVSDPEAAEAHLVRPLEQTRLRVFPEPRQHAAVQLLSNGRMHGMYHVSGGSSLRWGEIALTRWRDDPTTEAWGQFLYLRDVGSGAWWSAAHLPSRARVDRHEAIFSDAKVEYRIERDGIESHLEIVISSEEAAEVRRLRLANRSRAPRSIEFTTFAEVALGRQDADEAHPAFGNLFVRTECLRSKQALLCTRRPRSDEEAPPVLLHMIALHGADLEAISYETDRARFLGRTRGADRPQALDAGSVELGGGTGAVLDPAIAIRGRVSLQPGQRMVLDIVTGAAAERGDALAMIDKYRDRRMADRAFELAWTHAQVMRRQLGLSEADAALFARLAGLLVQPQLGSRGNATALRQNRSGQSALWPQAISGDLPIILLQLSSSDRLELVRRLLRAHAGLRAKGMVVDLVIVNQNQSTYRQELQDEIHALLAMDHDAGAIDHPGGVYVRSQEQLSADERVLLQAVARIVIDDRRGSLEAQLTRQLPAGNLPAPLAGPAAAPERRFNPVAGAPVVRPAPGPDRAAPSPAPEQLRFANGFGGFSADGREYVMALHAEAPTPMPWSNVLANERFGCVLSESGLGYTWCGNAHAYRLTPWHNDPVTDVPGEAFYIRDDASGQFWSPTPLPRRGRGSYRTRHGFGYSVYEHVEDDIASELWVFVDAERAVKHSLLKLHNGGDSMRHLSVWGYVEWVLGEHASKNRMHVVTEPDRASGALLARNAYHPEFGGHVAFFDIDALRDADGRRLCTHSGDRLEFIGKAGTLHEPAALQREALSGRSGVGLDPCGALQRRVDLAPGESFELGFRLGAAESVAAASELALATRGVTAAHAALARVREHWRELLSAVQVETPDPMLDLLVNGWLPYQIIASRVHARSGYYQSGGAFGFRDQLQDTMATVHALPELTRRHLLRSAAHQFPEGDVLHWWHPPGDRGVRTRCSDDYLWLPHAVCRYLEVTGDTGLFDEQVPFVEGRLVRADEEGYYDRPVPSGWTTSLYDHCKRALERGMRLTGERGLPLMGTGDWNDGMNKVGMHGRGESVWLGFFLYDVLLRFAPLAEAHGDAEFGDVCRDSAERLRRSIDEHAWDGQWYLRAWFDDGTPLGSAAGEECRIDAISQAWSVLSGAGDAARARQAMQSLSTHLVRRDAGLIQLLDPPFDAIRHDPGYIRGYAPGVRENGGQYTHAAIWATMAFARIGELDTAWELARMINPLSHALDRAAASHYQVEPYVIAADVYGVEPHVGRGGWTWYTGSAGWMYRLLLEELLGVTRHGRKLRIRPLLPPEWAHCTIRYRHGTTVHEIELRAQALAAGDVFEIELRDDGGHHRIELPAA